MERCHILNENLILVVAIQEILWFDIQSIIAEDDEVNIFKIMLSGTDEIIIKLNDCELVMFMNCGVLNLGLLDLKMIENEAFNGFTNIRSINLRKNKLKSFEFNLSKFTMINSNPFEKLQQLDLSYNLIENINDLTFDSMCNLEKLYLKSNQINLISTNAFFNLTKLKTLDLSNNQIQGVLATNLFFHLSNLKELNLRNNKINEIVPDSFKGLDNLLSLNLEANKLERLENPDLFAQMKTIECINLSYNKFKSLRANIFDCLKTNLLSKENDKIIDLKFRKQLTTFCFPKLFYLTNIDKYFFSEFCELNELNLSEIKLEKVEDNSFENLKNLTFLNLANNNLNQVKRKTFFGLERLDILLLNNNKINEIEKFSFESCKNLKKLDLSSNSDINEEILYEILPFLGKNNLTKNIF
jgi:Leucine-rich repeat (LRR) protein